MRNVPLCVVGLCLVNFCGQSFAQTNYIKNPGFEQEGPHWTASGEATTAKRVGVEPHGGAACLYVVDNGDTSGQGTSPNFVVPPGLYYIEAWVRAEPQYASVVHFDLQVHDKQKGWTSTNPVGETEATEWTLLAALVQVPDTAESVRVRVEPAFGDKKLRGACYLDDLLMTPLNEAIAHRRLRMKHQVHDAASSDPNERVGSPPPELVGKQWEYPSQVDFENLDGWKIETIGDVTASFSQSREEQLAGQYVGKIHWTLAGTHLAVISLRPPRPIPVGQRANAVQLWCHSDARPSEATGPAPQISIVVRQNQGLITIELPPIGWSFWSITHWRLPGIIGPDSEIVEIRISLRPAKHEVTRTFYFDELALHAEPTAPMDLELPSLLCSTAPEAIVPSVQGTVTNQVTSDGKSYRLIGRTDQETIEYIYTPRTGTLNDLKVVVNGRLQFHPATSGGPIAVDGHQRPQPTNVNVEAKSGTVRAIWQYRTARDSFEIAWQLRPVGKSLVLTVDEPQAKIGAWEWGKPSDLPTEEIAVPYLTHSCNGQPVRMVDQSVFVFQQPDWRVSQASVFQKDAAEYNPLTDGRRLPFHERIVLTVSSNFQEVLPNIPNPKSKTAHVLGENVYCNMAGSLDGDSFDRCLALWRQMKSLGMEKLIVKHHTDTWTSHPGQGDEPFVQSVTAAANIPGGEAALADYLRQVRSLGMQTFLYTDYCIVGPVNRHFEDGLCSLSPAGQWMIGWYSYFKLTPLMAPPLTQHFAPLLKQRYGVTGSYCDQHTSQDPSYYVDFDPRKPGAGMLQTVFRAYGKSFEIERNAHGGPVVSEGGNHWIYAGLVDGNYAQLSHELAQHRWQVPFLVDFNLRKVHPLEVDLGVGWRTSYGYDRFSKGPDDALDRFLCASIAFGGSGVFYPPDFPPIPSIHPDNPLGKWKRSVARTYFMIQQISSRYAMVPVQEINYWDGQQMLSPSDAVRTGAYQRSQVDITYSNGLRIWANGSFHDSWNVKLNGQIYELPPTGWLAVQGNEFLEYSAIRDGHRVDFIKSKTHTFVDGRGTMTDFGGGIQAKDALIILHDRGDEQHEIDTPMTF